MSGSGGGAWSAVCAARSRPHLLVAPLAFLACLLIFASTAHALSQRGHAFAGSFGEALGEGDEGKLSQPSAVAVNERTGEIYVLDAANNRVVVFGPEHKFIEMWGFGVSDETKVSETCKEKCHPGLAGFAKGGELDDPVAIAVDNSSGPSAGDVYVVANRTWKHAQVDKFSANGGFLDELISKEEKEEFEGAFDGGAVEPSTGALWIERGGEEEEF